MLSRVVSSSGLDAKMKVIIVLAAIVACVLAGQEEDLWLRYNRRMPGAYRRFGVPSTPTREGRIVGGVDADIANYPYQLSLRRNGGHSCGASVIATRWALSAAHCTFPVPPLTALQLVGGTSYRTQGGVIFAIEEVVNHPDYNDVTLEFDVCVLRVGADLTGVNISPIALDPIGTEHVSGTRAVVSGWGVTAAGTLPDILQRIDIPLIPDNECVLSWPGFVAEDMICAGEPGRTVCNADSGGPLVVGGFQIGVVSWGQVGCSGNLPAVFAQVAFPGIRNFISDITGA
ncbi:trypsin beta-like [Anopheles albimanus]|uniref:trypsin beta-like n=1 Tax=Anopheles albimanus TaxID=7167 RepID=UPI001640076E|nr:trypsin beta-like [Anopheles albimanus]